jgi:hypothetical protein
MRYLLLTLLIVILSLTALQTVQAELFTVNSDQADWSFWGEPEQATAYDWDEVPKQRNFDNTYPYGIYANGYGTSPNQVLAVKHDFETPCLVEDISVSPRGSFNVNRIVIEVLVEGIWTVVADQVQGSTSESYFFEVGLTVDSIQIEYVDEGNGINAINMNACGEPSDDWVRPLLAEDENDTLPLWDNPTLISALLNETPLDFSPFVAPDTQYRVFSASIEAGAPVMVAHGGTITDIEYASGSMCSIFGIIVSAGNACLFAGPDSMLSLFFNIYQFDIDLNVQRVTIQLGDGTELRYLVYNANKYVKLGDVVEAGCVIGETIAAESSRVSIASRILVEIVAAREGMSGLVRTGTSANFGVAMMELRDPGAPNEMVELLSKLTTYNTDAIPCNIDPNFQDCLLDDPDLKHGAEAWTPFGDTETSNGGVRIGPASYIQQVVNLPEDTTFTLRVGVYFDLLDLLGGNGEPVERQLLLRVGTFSTTQTVAVSSEYQEFTVEVADPGIDSSGLGYTVRIANVSNSGSIIVQAACLTTDDHELNPRACYFQNYSFDGTTGWTTPTNAYQGDGSVRLFHPESISQNVSLQPGTYRLEVDARIFRAPNLTYDPSPGSAVINYSWGALSGEVGELDKSWNLLGNPGYPDAPETLSVDIEVTEAISDTFEIGVVVTDNSTIWGVIIDRACISLASEDPPNDGIGGPFQTTCGNIPIPAGDDFGSWTMYHWRNLDKFFNCHLMVLLNRWFKSFDQFRLTMLYVARYWIAVGQHGADWMQSLIWWLNGHFRNIAVGQVTVINESGGCNGDILCNIANIISTLANSFQPIIDALANVVNVLLGVLIGAASLFFILIGGLMGFAVALVIQLLYFLQFGYALLISLITAYSTATPTVIPGLPACATDFDSSLLCKFVWVSDNTIFAGRWGALFTILLSIAAIHRILWAIAEFRSILTKTWGAS